MKVVWWLWLINILLGRDIEDAIKAKIITDDDIPKNVRDNLGRKKTGGK